MKRSEVTISDLFMKQDFSMMTYGAYELKYQQDSNQLCRFPELLEIFELGISIEKGNSWNSFRFIVRNSSKLPHKRKVAKILYKAFHQCKHIAVVLDNGYLEVTGSPKYVDEPFEVYRNRTLFELRDYLGLKHDGLGKDSIMLQSNHTGRFFKLES